MNIGSCRTQVTILRMLLSKGRVCNPMNTNTELLVGSQQLHDILHKVLHTVHTVHTTDTTIPVALTY